MRLITFVFLAFLIGSVSAQGPNNPNNLPICSDQIRYQDWNNCHVYLDLGGGVIIDKDILKGSPSDKLYENNLRRLFSVLYKFKKTNSLDIGTVNLSGAELSTDFSDVTIVGDVTRFNLVLNMDDNHPLMLAKNFGLNAFEYRVDLNCAKREFSFGYYAGYFGLPGTGLKIIQDHLPSEALTEKKWEKLIEEVGFSNLKNEILQATSVVVNTVCSSDIEKKIKNAKSNRQELERERGLQTENSNIATDNRKRFALVIGNSNYNSLPSLPNAVNDARVITQSLRSAGFQVSTHENLDLAGMQNAVRSFGEKLGKNDVGLVYYAGHGVQVKGKNYLIPVKENIKKSFEVPSSAIDVDLVLATLENIKNDLNIVVLDACRSSFPGEARGTNRGLATIEAAKGTFIAFATAPGKEALDGSGSNSPYTKHLSKLIGKKGLPLEQVFKEVRKAVVAETNGEQVPWENSSLMGDFYFQK